MSSSLTGTLNGADVQTMFDAYAQQQAQQLAQQTQQAAAASQQATQQYQQAAAAPAPQLGALDVGLPTLLGGLASIFEGNGGAQQRAQEGIQAQRASLIKARADNLAALRDAQQQKAEAAKQAGDLESELKARTSLEKLSQVHADVLYQSQRADAAALREQQDNAAMERERLRAATDLRIAGIQAAAKGAAAGEGDTSILDNEVKQNSQGKSYLPLTNIPPKAKMAALAYAKANGIPAVSAKDDDRLGRLDIARQNVGDMIESLRTFAPKDFRDVGTMAKNKLADISGANPEIRNYHTFYEALIEQLVALAGGTGSGVRINKAEIDRLQKVAPTVTTPLPVAERWAERVLKLIDNTESPVLGRKNIGPQTTQAAPSNVSRATSDPLGIRH